MKISKGITRVVFIFDTFVVKLPRIYKWTMFLQGLISNMNEKFWWKHTKDPRLCPVLFTSIGGFFLIMKRATLIKDVDRTEMYVKFEGLPLDLNPSNFGTINGEIVLIDYGS